MPYDFGIGALDVPRLDATGTASINFAVGYHFEERLAVLMSVFLVRGDSYLEDEITRVYDLQFGLRLLDLNTGETTEPIFDTSKVANLIRKEASTAVLYRIIEATGLLVAFVLPRHITMETYHQWLPHKALYKYWWITGYLADTCHFRIMDHFRDGTSGINYWFYSRSDVDYSE